MNKNNYNLTQQRMSKTQRKVWKINNNSLKVTSVPSKILACYFIEFLKQRLGVVFAQIKVLLHHSNIFQTAMSDNL